MKTHQNILLALIFFISPSLLAENDEVRYYDVEIILFENLKPSVRGNENWPINVQIEKPENMVTLGEPVISDILPEYFDPELSFKILSPNNYQLSDEKQRLTDSEYYRVLLHTGWRQPGMAKENAIPVYFSREISPMPLASETVTPVESEQLYSQPPPYTGPFELEGMIRVILARYLHVEAELIYKPNVKTELLENTSSQITASNSVESDEEVDPDELANTLEYSEPRTIHLKQIRRRMRSNELHYLDHPVLGMLIRITPYLLPEEVEPATQSTAPDNRGAIKR